MTIPTDIPTIKMSEVIPLLIAGYKAGLRNFGLLGPSGIGKTQIVQQIAAHLRGELNLDYDAKCVIYRAGHKGLVDMGVPVPDHDIHRVRTYTPLSADLPDAKRDGEVGVWLLDEGNALPKQLQGPMFGMIEDRVLGETEFPKEWMVVLTGNRVEDMGVANKMAAPLNDRLVLFNVEPDLESFKDYTAKAGIVNAHLITGFLDHRPALLHCAPGTEAVDPAKDWRITMPKDARSFPTPRGYHKIAPVLSLPAEVRQPLVAGQLGCAVASELEGYLQVAVHLPSVDEVLADPEGCRLPDEKRANNGVKYAMVSMLAYSADVESVVAFGTYCSRIGKEFEALFYADVNRRDPKLLEMGSYVDLKTR